MKLCIIGAGAFGSAMAVAQEKNFTSISLWSRTKLSTKNAENNTKFLYRSKFPKNIQMTSTLTSALDMASVIMVCIPAQHVYDFLKNYQLLMPTIPIILCSKGIDEQSLLLQSQIVKHFLPKNKIAILTGPSFASEVAIGLPTALTLATSDYSIGTYLQKLLSTQSLRLYSSNDIVGAQVGGSLKNVIAIGCGMVKGANLGESARTALMTRGLSEIIHLGIAMGGNLNTFYGLSGLGDLALTCSSKKSRNFLLGFNFSKNIIKKSNSTVEGIKTASAAYKLATKLNVDVPIIQMVDHVMKNKVSLNDSIKDLLSRPLKKEVH